MGGNSEIAAWFGKNTLDLIKGVLSDPLQYGQRILVVAIAIVVIALLYQYWNRFVFLLTGDDRIHWSTLDCLWSLCRCFGFCNGEWTRLVSKFCCCTDFLCCKKSLRGRNLVRWFGQQVGWATTAIEIKNIVVGDLPFDNGRGDFYLSVEASTNPPMVTALQEEKLPKLVHFPEILQLKIRDSPLEPRVRIVVKELNVLGSVELCDAHFNADQICDWTREEDCVKRFYMRQIDNSVERETPAWILIEFAECDDVRGVESIPIPIVRQEQMKVRTWVPSSHETIKKAGVTPIVTGGQTTAAGGTIWGETNPRMNIDLPVTSFKNAYQLLDDSGNGVSEPAEASLARLRWMRLVAKTIVGACQCSVLIIIFGYLFARFYVWSCYHHFTMDTIAFLRGATFPISNHNLHIYYKACQEMFDGTGLGKGNVPGPHPLAAACRPNATTVINFCQNMNTLTHGTARRPEAFTFLASEYLGIHLPHGLRCFDGICEFRNKLAQYDFYIAVFCVLLFISTFLCRYCMNSCIKASRKRNQAEQARLQATALNAAKASP